MTPEERAARLVVMDEKDHCTMRIGGFALKFGDATKMTEKQAAQLVQRVRRAISEEIADAVEDADLGATQPAKLSMQQPEEPAPTPPLPPAAESPTSMVETAAALLRATGIGSEHTDIIVASLSESYRRGVEAMRAQAKESLGAIYPTLDASMRIEVGEVRKAIVERLDNLEVGQAATKAAA